MQIRPDRCIVRFGGTASRRNLLASASSVSRDDSSSAVDSPERRPAAESATAAPARLLLATCVRLQPGENRIVLEAAGPQPNGLLEPTEELLVQCGRLHFYSEPAAAARRGGPAPGGGGPRSGGRIRRGRLCDASWRDPVLRRRLLPCLEMPVCTAKSDDPTSPSSPPPLLLHFEHRLRVRLRPGLLGLACSSPADGGRRPELRLLPLLLGESDGGAFGGLFAGCVLLGRFRSV